MRHQLDRELKNKVFRHLLEFNEIRDMLTELSAQIDEQRKSIDFFSTDVLVAAKVTDNFLALNERIQKELERLEAEREKSNQTLQELENKYGKGHIDYENPEYYETYN